jgi:hypothetical protein
MDRGDLKGLIGVMVDFKEDDNPLTSGNGKFLNELDVGFIDDSDIPRCSKQILDPPPHDANYFLSQLKAVKNYYYSISNGTIDLEIDMIDSVYTAVDSIFEGVQGEEQEMEFFAHSENDITQLYKTSVELADQAIAEKALSYGWDDGEDFLIVVFHAGLGSLHHHPIHKIKLFLQLLDQQAPRMFYKAVLYHFRSEQKTPFLALPLVRLQIYYLLLYRHYQSYLFLNQ